MALLLLKTSHCKQLSAEVTLGHGGSEVLTNVATASEEAARRQAGLSSGYGEPRTDRDITDSCHS